MFKLLNFKKKYTLKDLVISSFLCALSIILTRVLKIESASFRFSFGFVPILISGAIQGPLLAAMTASVADLLGIIIQGGNIHLGYTLSSAISGCIFGFMLYRKEKSIFLIGMTHFLNTFIISIVLNTFWTYSLQGGDYWELLKLRVVLNIPVFVVRILVTYLVYVYIIETTRKWNMIDNV